MNEIDNDLIICNFANSCESTGCPHRIPHEHIGTQCHETPCDGLKFGEWHRVKCVKVNQFDNIAHQILEAIHFKENESVKSTINRISSILNKNHVLTCHCCGETKKVSICRDCYEELQEKVMDWEDHTIFDQTAYQLMNFNINFICSNCNWKGKGKECIFDENLKIESSEENNLLCPQCEDIVEKGEFDES